MTLFIISFIAGVLTVMAPCILPLLPVILAGSLSETSNKRRPLIIIGALSLSVLIFTLLLKGTTALLTVSPIFWTYVSATILAGFALTLLFPIAWAKLVLKIPGHNKPDRWISKGYGEKESVWSDIVVGAALGPVFTTCSPTFFVIIATVLPQSFGKGLIDLAAYIFGLALSLLLIATLGQKFIGRLDWATNPEGIFRKILGVVFLLVAAAIATGYDKKIQTAVIGAGFFDVTKLEQSISQSLSGTRSAEGRYTELTGIAGYVNSEPFKLADHVGKKVILVDFIDYSCINCQRTFPYMKDWWSKYKDQGLEVVAIHTPEFAFEKDIKNVTAAAKRFDLQFPIVLDNDYSTWNAYKNQYWPHKYLIDINGNVVYDHIGEGEYAETEAEIVKQLNIRKQVLGEAGMVTMGAQTVADYDIRAASPETYFGSDRNKTLGNGTPYVAGTQKFTLPTGDLKPDLYYLGGTWNIDREFAENVTAGATLSYVFTATKMYLVAENPDGSQVTATIMIDGKIIPAEQAGVDVKDGKLMIDASRLYGLYENATVGRHRIDIMFAKPSVRVYTFTFG